MTLKIWSANVRENEQWMKAAERFFSRLEKY
jgi:hypothetical protein